MADPFAPVGADTAVIPMADPFAPTAADTAVIPMDDPFASPTPTPAPTPRPSEGTRSSQSTISRYESVVETVNADEGGLFSGLRKREDGEPCFVDGIYIFYSGYGVRNGSSGGVKDALYHIFRHWYVSRVFHEDGKTYREDFLHLMKVGGFASREKELRAIAENPVLTVNQKFFRLFYGILCKNSINGFFWNEEDSPISRITPRFLNPTDFYKKMAELSDPTAFLAIYEDCFEELLFFLRSGKETDAEEGRAWFLANFPLIMAEETGCIYTVTERGGRLQIRSLGRLRDFAASFADLAAPAVMEERIQLFERFRISKNRALMPRSEPIVISRASETEDDSVYALTGILTLAASRAATAYNYYMTLLSEYVDSFRPDRLTVGGMTFTRRNFYGEVLAVVKAACAHLSEEDGRVSPEEQRFFLVKSLFSRGIFRDFERDCEADRLAELRRAFLTPNRLELEAYFAFDTDHDIYIDGVLTDIDGYLHKEMGKGCAHMRGLARTGSTVLNAYFAARTRREEVARVSNEIEDLIRSYEASLSKL